MIWFEVLVGFAIPVAWGVWQLIDLKRERGRDEAKRTAAAETPAGEHWVNESVARESGHKR